MSKPSYHYSERLAFCLAIGILALCLSVIGLESAKAVGTLQGTPQWSAQPSGTSEVLLGVSFTDVSKGYAVGTNGVIRVTTNGGSSWSSQTSGTSRFLRDVYFSDATHGSIVGESGLILRTIDGNTWTPQTSGTTQHLVHVHFVDNSVGIATGQGGVILRTIDGGANWIPQTSGTSVELPGAYLLDGNTGIVVGFGGTILRTTNGGSSWTSVAIAGFTSDLRSVHFFGANGVAVSIGGRILRSTNSGQSWNEVSSGTANDLYAVKFIDANIVYAVGTASVRVSSDRGSTWAAATTISFFSDLYGLAFSSAKGWAVGQNGLILHAEDLLPTPTPTPTPSAVQLSASSYSVGESEGRINITVNRPNDISAAVTVDYATSDSGGPVVPCSTINGIASSRCDFTTALGTLRFAAGESSKTFTVLISQDNYVEGPETLTLTLSNPSNGAFLGTPSTATLTITDDPTEPSTNPADDAEVFVRQHYHDFLNREADAGGLAFWANQITECQAPGATCSAEVRRINVSAAFFLSIEFQETGYLVERLYKAAYGDALGTSNFGATHQLFVPVVRFNEFLPDTQQIGKDVVVGQTGWEQVLENNKVAFTQDFVSRSRFTAAYPTTLSPAQFVDALYANAGVTPSASERTSVINEFSGAGNTADAAARARALRRVAQNTTLSQQETNKAFVLMQYFGYLRRNPNDAPDADYTGYDFWLTKLNEFNGNFVTAEMVKAFIVSGEYRQRFGL
jgi:photosystem II stability/assembly factor-like uncharacterized protein